jgi:hypothetical protein
MNTLERFSVSNFLVLMAFGVGVWAALGLWEVIGPLALMVVVSTPIILFVSIFPVASLWPDAGVVGRSLMIFAFVLSAVVVCQGITREGMHLLRWAGVAIAFSTALGSTLIVSALFTVLPMYTVIVGSLRWAWKNLRFSATSSRDE